MGYSSLRACVLDLEKHGHLIRIREEVDPNLEMAAIHLRVFKHGGPALFFENVKGCAFPAVSNLFGSRDRVHFIFRDTWKNTSDIIRLKDKPLSLLKRPGMWGRIPVSMIKALPQRVRSAPVLHGTTKVSELPQIKCWPDDGGPFVTLPQVYTESADDQNIWNSNLGMYRIQLGGNDYVSDKEVGLHYQIHRGIGVHQEGYSSRNLPMKVSVFVGGPPAHTFAAVMPLPEGMSELLFAGLLGGRRFRHVRKDGYVLSGDADFVITGEVKPGENKPEGPFGDHLGYYSLRHPFPVMHVHKVWHRKDAIWPFTVVGRPPQEDTFFGELIHDLSGPAIPSEIPGLSEVHAVDAAGVHPLLLARGQERYTPFHPVDKPQELLTIASHVLGTGQLSLAKYLFIGQKTERGPSAADVESFFSWMLERINPERDLHFLTNTTIDTLDYSGEGMNSGSKLIVAAVDQSLRELTTTIPTEMSLPGEFKDARLVAKGIMALSGPAFSTYAQAEVEVGKLCQLFANHTEFSKNGGIPLVVLCDDSWFVSERFGNFIWTTFTRSNPSHDVYGVKSFTRHKHWGCEGSIIIDARSKPHHAPALIPDPEVERRVDRLGLAGASLHGII